MAERDASLVQLDFPQLTADLIRDLRLTGTLGLLNLSDTVIPIISVGNVRPQVIRTDLPVFDSAEVFQGSVATPGANAVIADTLALPAGDYDVIFGASITANNIFGGAFELQWRNAANAANLATWPYRVQRSAGDGVILALPNMALNIGLNERLRWVNISAITGTAAAWIMAALRPTP